MLEVDLVEAATGRRDGPEVVLEARDASGVVRQERLRRDARIKLAKVLKVKPEALHDDD
jgi:hypothetical protein